MITKRIQRRNANILKYHERGYDTRTIGRIFHLSHAQCANIIKKLKEQGKAELMDLEQRKNKEKGGKGDDSNRKQSTNLSLADSGEDVWCERCQETTYHSLVAISSARGEVYACVQCGSEVRGE